MPRSRTLRRKTSPRPLPPARRAGQAIEAEARLLALARELTELPAEATLADVVGRLGGAHGPDAPLPRALAQAWLRGRNDKTAALALAWAREQVRLALEERLILIGMAENDSGLPWIDLIRDEKQVFTSFCYAPRDFETSLRLLESRQLNLSPWTEIRPLDDGTRISLEFTGQAPTPV